MFWLSFSVSTSCTYFVYTLSEIKFIHKRQVFDIKRVLGIIKKMILK